MDFQFRPGRNFGRNRNFGRKPIPKLFRSYTNSMIYIVKQKHPLYSIYLLITQTYYWEIISKWQLAILFFWNLTTSNRNIHLKTWWWVKKCFMHTPVGSFKNPSQWENYSLITLLVFIVQLSPLENFLKKFFMGLKNKQFHAKMRPVMVNY